MKAQTGKIGEIKIGDKVKWTHHIYSLGCLEASGTVLYLNKITVGGGSKSHTKKDVAKIKLDPNPYWEEINRKTTTILVRKLKKI
ncbi:MAG: hypothetical protein A2031_08120 [Deltaproteobacteria bacterium RBG_19FT_COMBO_43_11]|nr:MAG: hypothetical protein A2031_08120 [Deltaproteobacteria bacterium RBG_19FT_COMBO_43_11]